MGVTVRMENSRGDLAIVTLTLLVLFVTISTTAIFMAENKVIKEEISVASIIGESVVDESKTYFYLEASSKRVLRGMYSEAYIELEQIEKYANFLESFSKEDFKNLLIEDFKNYNFNDDSLTRFGTIILNGNFEVSLEGEVLVIETRDPLVIAGVSKGIEYEYSKIIKSKINLGFLS